MKYHGSLTIHHKLPESFGGNLRPNNTIQLRENTHRALHTIFQNDTPLQRVRRMIEVDKTVMRPEVYLAISDTLKKFEGILEYQMYEPDCVNIDKFLRTHKNVS